MTEITANGDKTNTMSLTRLPVFDANRRLWGYELFCLESRQFGADCSFKENVAKTLANSAYIGLQGILDRGKKIVLSFNAKSLLYELPYALPPVSAVVKIDKSVIMQKDAAMALNKLKADGFLIALTGFSIDREAASLLKIADIICVETEKRSKTELEKETEILKKYDVGILAQRVEDSNRFDLLKILGFTLFSGSFFKAPDMIKVRKMSSSEVSRFNLLKLLEIKDPDFEKIAKTIQTDATVSFRLLSYLNSTAFGFTQKIKSIHQAISMLGWDRLKKWLCVILMTDVEGGKDSAELMLLSAQRGMFLELVSKEHDFWGFNPDSMHLLGLFSLLDVMLGIPMKEITAHLPIDGKLKNALCGNQENEYYQMLILSRLFEEARWGEAKKKIHQLNLDERKVQEAFKMAVDFAIELLTMKTDA